MKDNLFIKNINGSVSLLVNVCKVNSNTYKIYNVLYKRYIKIVKDKTYTDLMSITDVQLFIESNKLKPVNKDIANIMLNISSIRNKERKIII